MTFSIQLGKTKKGDLFEVTSIKLTIIAALFLELKMLQKEQGRSLRFCLDTVNYYPKALGWGQGPKLIHIVLDFQKLPEGRAVYSDNT